jgi:hypothetical protein
LPGIASLNPQTLVNAVVSIVGAEAEGGRRAQAVVAGLMDVVYSSDRVESGRVNDPSRHYPGDVVVWSPDLDIIEKAFEVRDKPVSTADAMVFLNRAQQHGIREAGIVACNAKQPQLDRTALDQFTVGREAEITVFYDWGSLVQQTLFWSPTPQWQAAATAYTSIADRMIQIECDTSTLQHWRDLF